MSFRVLSLKGEKRQVNSLDFKNQERNARFSDYHQAPFCKF
jgi:hypothetical protein